MKLVVDTNILITFFWKTSATRKLFAHPSLELCAPEYALEEISKHQQTILSKTKLSSHEFKQTKEELAILVAFVPLQKYQSHLKHAYRITPDNGDTDFVALALKDNHQLWSNDSALKQIKTVTVLNTKEIIEILAEQMAEE